MLPHQPNLADCKSDVDLMDYFMSTAESTADPYKFSPICKKEIENIINKGISRLSEIGHGERDKKISESKKSLEYMISLMIAHRKKLKMKIKIKDKELTSDDLDYAKNEVCPTWPCDD